MLHYHHLDSVDITLVNFKKIFSVIQRELLNDCHNLGLIKNDSLNLNNKDVKRLLLHHTIHQLCEEIITSKHQCKDVVLYRPLKADDTFEILRYVDLNKLNSLLTSIVLSAKKILPIQIAVLDKDISFQTLKEKLEKGNGEVTELIYKLLCNLTAINISFESVKKFTKKNKLTFLSKEYFDKLRTKQLFYI